MNDVRSLLQDARRQLGSDSEDPLLDAQVLLAHALGRDRAWLYAHPEHIPSPPQIEQFSVLLDQREAGHPVSHLTGHCEFWSLPLAVDAHTLIPRPETELLVETALGLDLPNRARVLDLGTGSGAIALALASERPDWQIVAVDRSPAALTVARHNLDRLALRNMRIMPSNWFDALHDAPPFDLIVSNPPYVADQDPHLQQGDVRFEPREALLSGSDGLNDIRHIVGSARQHLSPGGWLWLEHGYDQADRVCALLRGAGFDAVRALQDLAGCSRISGGRNPLDRSGLSAQHCQHG